MPNGLAAPVTESLRSGLTGDFWADWDKLVKGFGDNACCLSSFMEHFARQREGWHPLLIKTTIDGKTIGVIALRTEGFFGARRATQLLSPVYGTDFVVDPQYRRIFIHEVLKHIFGILRCQTLDLTLPGESPNLVLLREVAKSFGYRLEDMHPKSHHEWHSVILVEGTWDDFKAARGGSFTRHFRKIEKKLDRIGIWAVLRSRIDNAESVDQVNIIEKNSWKNSWRKDRGITSDSYLDALLEFWKSGHPDRADIPMLWLLQLNGDPIAYATALLLNRVAILCKTSYDMRYAGLYCGEYVQNVALSDLFDPQKVSVIDFLTPFDYHRRWTSLRRRKIRIVILKPVPILSPLVSALEANSRVRAVYRLLRAV